MREDREKEREVKGVEMGLRRKDTIRVFSSRNATYNNLENRREEKEDCIDSHVPLPIPKVVSPQ